MKTIKILPSPKLEIYKDTANEWRWNIKVNGETIGASSEGYKNRQDCVDNIKNLKKRIEFLEKNNLIV